MGLDSTSQPGPGSGQGPPIGPNDPPPVVPNEERDWRVRRVWHAATPERSEVLFNLRADGQFLYSITPSSGESVWAGTWATTPSALVLHSFPRSPLNCRYAVDTGYLLLLDAEHLARIWTDAPVLAAAPPTDRQATWAQALLDQDTGKLLSLVDSCPSAPSWFMDFTRDDVRRVVGQHDRSTLMSLAGFAQALLPTSPTDAKNIAGALWAVVDTHSASTDPALLPVAERAADIETRGISATNDADQVVSAVARQLSWLEARGSRRMSCSLALQATESLLLAGQAHRAETWLALAQTSDPANQDEADTRASYTVKVTEALRDATDLPDPDQGSVDRYRVSALDDLTRLRELINVTPLDEQAGGGVSEVLDQVTADLNGETPLSAMEMALELGSLLGLLASPADDGHLDPSTELKRDTSSLQMLLTDPDRGHDPECLRDGVLLAGRIRVTARALERSDQLNVATWALAILHRRLGQHNEAVDTMVDLWRDLEEQRARIPDPTRRAAAFSGYPHLFVSLAAELLETARGGELFDVIEGGKGRLLADVLASRSSLKDEVATAQAAHLATESATGRIATARPRDLPGRTHLLTFLVDDDRTFVALEAADGSRHSSVVPLARAALRSYAANVDPSTWGRKMGGLGRPPVPDDLPDRLAPLLAWLEPLQAEGVIALGDHLCCSPDDALYLVPLHVLTFAGRPLVESFSVSRVHGLHTLAGMMASPASVPHSGFVIEVPARDDSAAAVVTFARAGDRLAALLPCHRLRAQQATPAALGTTPLTDRVVHFTTHGTFPRTADSAPQLNPYSSAGLLLAEAGGAPSVDDVAAGTAEGLLTPNQIGGLNFSGSHVTTQACSCGLSREGAGGDALGVELAFLLGGASSVLTTHWDVSAGPAAEFCSRFYDGWLGRGLSRAEAWRAAARTMKDEGRPMYEWAAFSLAGDWR